MAPLGPRKVMGIVWDEGRLPGEEIAFERMRPILEVVPVPPLPAPLRRSSTERVVAPAEMPSRNR